MKKILFLLLITLGLGSVVEAQNPPRVVNSALSGSAWTRFADDGTHFCAMTQTPGTAYNLSAAAQASFSATQAMWTLRNAATAAQGTRIYPVLAKIIYATAGTGGTRVEVAVALDDATRFSAGGTAVSIKNTNQDVTTASIATVNAGDLTANAAGANVRYVGRATLSTAIPAVGETYTINFGYPVDASHIGKSASLPAVVIGPTQSMVIHEWSPSQSATPTGELLLCWIER